MSEQKSKQVFQNLNGLRFIGALSVFVFHTTTLSREMWGGFFQGKIFQAFYTVASKGHYGVGLFFVLSGFLITNLLLRELETTKTIQVKNFFFRRILRIWPVYFLVLIFGFFVFPLLPYGQSTNHSLLHYAFFLSNMDEIWNGWNDSLNFLTVSWSVSAEEQFYMLLLLILGVLPFLRNQKVLLIYFVVVILLCVGYRFIHYSDHRAIYYHSLSVTSDLAIGGLLAFYIKRKGPSLMTQWNRFHILIIYLIGICFLLFSRSIFVGHWIAFERIVHSTFFAFVLCEQMFSKHSFFKADKLPGFFFSGKLTYGFYMYHCISLYYWAVIFDELDLTQSSYCFAVYFLINLATTYGMAFFSFRFIEVPFLRLKRYFRS